MFYEKKNNEIKQIEKAIFRTERELYKTNELLLLLMDYMNENPVITVELVLPEEV